MNQPAIRILRIARLVGWLAVLAPQCLSAGMINVEGSAEINQSGTADPWGLSGASGLLEFSVNLDDTHLSGGSPLEVFGVSGQVVVNGQAGSVQSTTVTFIDDFVFGDTYDVVNIEGQATIAGTTQSLWVSYFLHSSTFGPFPVGGAAPPTFASTMPSLDRAESAGGSAYYTLTVPGVHALSSTQVTSVPEPSSLALLAAGSLTCVGYRRRRKRQMKKN